MHTGTIRSAAVALILMAFVGAPVRASELSDDLKARRGRVMEKLGPDAIAILWSAPSARYSLDIDYEYRQDSNLYYLTGITQEQTILVLMPGNQSKREILFVWDRNPLREHWTGRRLTHEEAAERSGIDTVLDSSQFDAFIAAMLNRRGFEPLEGRETAPFFDALAMGRGRVALTLDAGRQLNAPLTPALEFARTIRDRFVGFQVSDATPLLTALRLVKTPYERKVLAASLEISSEAQLAGMRAARADAYEYELVAAIEAAQRSRGAVSWSYPSIVGSGPNATVLHYHGGERQMHTGDLVLVDAAANYQYASGDITRTYPISGAFTPAQRDIYQIVLQAQDEGMKAATAGSSLEAIHQKTVDVIKAGLLKLGLITDAAGDQYKMWYTHGSTHYIGLDVHDVGDRRAPLVPGMSFVIEPGIYIRQSALDSLPRTPENNALVEKVQAAVSRYADIGVRIEDSFLLEETGLRRLSASVPRTIEEIEAFLQKRQPRAGSQR
jgi:Xaa-Pro aminopeptidase